LKLQLLLCKFRYSFLFVRYLTLIFLTGFLAFSCVKRNGNSPIPEITFQEFRALKGAGGDSAVFLLGYKDGDGDLFLDKNEQGPNLIITPYYFNSSKNEYLAEFNPDPLFNDTMRIYAYIKQPSNGYYKDKSIKGEILFPTTGFRSGSQKIFKYRLYMKDLKGNKTQVLTTPSYTISF
jgi:hypothetical protein